MTPARSSASPADTGADVPILEAENLSVRYGRRIALSNVSLRIPRGRVVAIMGPPSSGKSTLLGSFCRMNELVVGALATGSVFFNGEDVHSPSIDVYALRRRVGMVFGHDILFPGSVFDNLAFGLRAGGLEGDLHRVAEEALRSVGLSSGREGMLDRPARDLSPDERRRMCMARALALDPEVLLLDEPSAHFDPASAARVENVIHRLRGRPTMVVATHDPMCAGRVSDFAAYLDSGRLIEFGPTQRLLTSPRERRTEMYLTGRGL